jgi:hypothetical protein
MKKLLVAFALAGFATTASAAIAGSSHDLTSTGLGGYTGTISACQFCHAPHNVNTGVSGAPLWNRNSVTTSFTYYTSTTVSATPSALNANSMTCMSCHDGVSDMGDTYTGSHGFGGTVTTLTGAGATYAIVGADLRDDHPVSITYVPAANSLAAVATVTTAGLRLYGAGPSIECGSCHDPHGTGVTGGDSDGLPGGGSFLRVTRTAICTTCHLK